MYVRSRGPMTPPVNYAGVTFSRNNSQNTERDKDTKIHKAVPVNEIHTTFKTAEQSITEDIPKNCAEDIIEIEEKCENEEVTPSKEPPKCPEKEEQKGILSDILGDKFSLEDILLFGALFLLISGQIDDEILLLAGILLLFGN